MKLEEFNGIFVKAINFSNLYPNLREAIVEFELDTHSHVVALTDKEFELISALRSRENIDLSKKEIKNG